MAAFLEALLVGLVAFAAGAFARARVPRGIAFAVVVAVAVVAAIPWALFVAYYFHFGALDGTAYYEWRTHAWTELLPGLVGVVIALVLRPLQLQRGDSDGTAGVGRLALEPVNFGTGAIALVGALLLAFAKPLLSPMASSNIHDQWRDDVCLQSTPATCGPCAAATVLRAIGIEAGETELARASSSTTSGTLNWLLVRHLRDELGLHATFREPASMADVRAPAIVGVRIASFGHFIALLGRDADGRYIIGEPLHGRVVADDAELARRYRFDHFAIEIAR